MAIAQGLTSSFKAELLQAVHNFSTDVFKIALYSSSATLGATTTVYSSSGEVTGTGYTAGGSIVTVSYGPVISGTYGVVNFANVSWIGSTFTTGGALIYNTSKSNKAVLVLSFGADQTVSNGNFVITMPSNSNPLLQLR